MGLERDDQACCNWQWRAVVASQVENCRLDPAANWPYHVQSTNTCKCDLLRACICQNSSVGDATGGAVFSVGDTEVPGLITRKAGIRISSFDFIRLRMRLRMVCTGEYAQGMLSFRAQACRLQLQPAVRSNSSCAMSCSASLKVKTRISCEYCQC